MKSGIHPEYTSTEVICSCGSTFTTRSTAKGGEIRRFAGWSYDWTIDKGSRWTVAEIDRELRARAEADASAEASPPHAPQTSERFHRKGSS